MKSTGDTSLLAAAAQDSALWNDAFAAAMAASGYQVDEMASNLGLLV